MSITNSEAIEKRAFLLERRLKEINPNLHAVYRAGIFAIDRLLNNYKTDFPFFTDHTFEHSAQLINYCNILIGEENINELNADEIYVLLMGACLHDVGMGITKSDFDELASNIPGIGKWLEDHPDSVLGDATRTFHNDLSAEFVSKYSALFEIPSPEHIYCIAQVCRGHRKQNLLDANKFNPDYKLPDGTKIRLPYLAALVKLADELDVTADRNLLLDYETYIPKSESSVICFKSHGALKQLALQDDEIILYYRTDEEEVLEEIRNIEAKINQTFSEYEAVMAIMNDFTQIVKKIKFINLKVTE